MAREKTYRLKLDFYNTDREMKNTIRRVFPSIIMHPNSMHFRKKILQKCNRKFCFSQWAFENSLKLFVFFSLLYRISVHFVMLIHKQHSGQPQNNDIHSFLLHVTAESSFLNCVAHQRRIMNKFNLLWMHNYLPNEHNKYLIYCTHSLSS